jgi:hypothetical protein
MWQFVFSNAAPEDPDVLPPVPVQPQRGSLGRLLRAIENGAPIRVGMLRAGTIHYSVFDVESVRYWKADDDSDYVALAAFPVRASNLNYDPSESDPRFGPWFKGVSVTPYRIVDTKGFERFWFPGIRLRGFRPGPAHTAPWPE